MKNYLQKYDENASDKISNSYDEKKMKEDVNKYNRGLKIINDHLVKNKTFLGEVCNDFEELIKIKIKVIESKVHLSTYNNTGSLRIRFEPLLTLNGAEKEFP